MIRRIQALNYRCLRYVDLEVDRFHVAVGPNASGKSTLFDVVAFLGDMVREGVDTAVEKRTRNFQDLVWGRPGKDPRFELAVEFEVPDEIQQKLPADRGFRFFRYEVAIEEQDNEVRINSERGLLIRESQGLQPQQRTLFPLPPPVARGILTGGGRRGSRTVLSKSPKKQDNFNIEVSPESGKGWAVSVSFGPHRSALGNLPESPEKFPVATHVKRTLTEGVKSLFLDADRMREASPPGLRRNGFAPDGSNLPWTVKALKEQHPADYSQWMDHVRTALQDLKEVSVVERDEDRHAYLTLGYETGVTVPSWVASDGTLRFLALTLLGYVPSPGIYLIEEPENGLHPFALDAVYDALSSAHDSQVLSATHSPAFLKLADPEEVLCFAKNSEGATDIVRGDRHPLLRGLAGQGRSAGSLRYRCLRLMDPVELRDLVVLVPDADIEQTVRGLLDRSDDLGIRAIRWTVTRHPERDPGCRVRAMELLRPFVSSSRYALVVFDQEGCGSSKPRETIQSLVESKLSSNGWMDRAKAIVIDPELEVWLWNGSPDVAEELGWGRDYSGLRAHLASKDLWPLAAVKPPDPKRAAREAMKVARVRKRARRSPAKFRRLASRVASPVLSNCQDPAFLELISTLRDWFPATSGQV